MGRADDYSLVADVSAVPKLHAWLRRIIAMWFRSDGSQPVLRPTESADGNHHE